MWRFQKILLIQNPDPYLIRTKDSDSAIVMKNATFSWLKPGGQTDAARRANGHTVAEESQNKTTDLPTLKNFSFTLPKVIFLIHTEH